jgi:DNA end-binding protein Ku
MAMQLIDSLSGEWQPAKYNDEYRDNLMKVIQGKLKGRQPRLQERETPQSADVVDLMARLRASLERKGTVNAKPRISKKRTKASGRKRKPAA